MDEIPEAWLDENVEAPRFLDLEAPDGLVDFDKRELFEVTEVFERREVLDEVDFLERTEVSLDLDLYLLLVVLGLSA